MSNAPIEYSCVFAAHVYVSVVYVPCGATVGSWCALVFNFSMYYPVFPKVVISVYTFISSE